MRACLRAHVLDGVCAGDADQPLDRGQPGEPARGGNAKGLGRGNELPLAVPRDRSFSFELRGDSVERARLHTHTLSGLRNGDAPVLTDKSKELVQASRLPLAGSAPAP